MVWMVWTKYQFVIKPEDLGIKRAKREEILGGSVEENVEITYKILTGKEKGPKRDIVLVNAAAAIYVGGKSKDLKAGIKIASDSIESGAANKKLEELIACTSKLKN